MEPGGADSEYTMAGATRPTRLNCALLLGAALGSACATGRAVSQPSPFPTVAGPSASPTSVSTARAEADAVVQSALSLQGTRYRLGGQNPRGGLDCSGLVRYVFLQQNVSLPRTVDEQFGSGRSIGFDQIQAGDLLFFATTKAGLETGSATHVGIATGPPALGEFVHAPGTGGAVRIDRFDAPYWRARWVGARRLF